MGVRFSRINEGEAFFTSRTILLGPEMKILTPMGSAQNLTLEVKPIQKELSIPKNILPKPRMKGKLNIQEK